MATPTWEERPLGEWSLELPIIGQIRVHKSAGVWCVFTPLLGIRQRTLSDVVDDRAARHKALDMIEEYLTDMRRIVARFRQRDRK